MLYSQVVLYCLAALASGSSLPTSPPDPLHRALTDPNFIPPKDDIAEVGEVPTNGPLAQGLLAPVNKVEGTGRTKRHHCHKCGRGGYGDGGYGGGGYGGGGGGGYGGYGGGYVQPAKVVVVPVTIQKGWGGGGYGGGQKGYNGGGCSGGCGGGGYPSGGGGYNPGGGGSWSYSQSQASSSAGSGGYNWGKK